MTLPEVANVIRATLSRVTAHGIVTYSSGIEPQPLVLRRLRQQLAPPEVQKILIRTDSFEDKQVARIANSGSQEGWVFLQLPRIYFDTLSMAGLSYDDQRRQVGVSSSLDLFIQMRNEVDRVASIDLSDASGRKVSGLKCSERSRILISAGYKLGIAFYEDERCLEPRKRTKATEGGPGDE